MEIWKEFATVCGIYWQTSLFKYSRQEIFLWFSASGYEMQFGSWILAFFLFTFLRFFLWSLWWTKAKAVKCIYRLVGRMKVSICPPKSFWGAPNGFQFWWQRKCFLTLWYSFLSFFFFIFLYVVYFKSLGYQDSLQRPRSRVPLSTIRIFICILFSGFLLCVLMLCRPHAYGCLRILFQ